MLHITSLTPDSRSNQRQQKTTVDRNGPRTALKALVGVGCEEPSAGCGATPEPVVLHAGARQPKCSFKASSEMQPAHWRGVIRPRLRVMFTHYGSSLEMTGEE